MPIIFIETSTDKGIDFCLQVENLKIQNHGSK